jgi:hypothetical protein
MKSSGELAKAAAEAGGRDIAEPAAISQTAPAEATRAGKRPGAFADGTPATPARDLVEPRGEPGQSAIPEYSAIKAHEAKVDDYLEQTVSAKAIADRGYYEPPGGHGDAIRTGNANKAIIEGQRDPIKLNIDPDG